MRIAVCDDIPKELEKILAALGEYGKAHPELCFEIDEYSTALGILNAVEKGKGYDIAFLDIFMPGILGTDVAGEMLSKSPDMGIIFLSISSDYAVTAFAMNAIHYLLKPFSQEQFDIAMDRAVKKVVDYDVISLSCVDGVYRVRISEIVFIESQGHYLLLRLSSGEDLRMRKKIFQMFEEIKKYSEFIQVGGSYIANLYFVRKISVDGMKMYNGAMIPIPRRSREKVRKAYMDFCWNEAMK
ncbi:DNA-binding response regulator [Lachnospiraceae bacterium]|nr:DNA-binding response regulator [Lachnospiraceae bacterium]